MLMLDKEGSPLTSWAPPLPGATPPPPRPHSFSENIPAPAREDGSCRGHGPRSPTGSRLKGLLDMWHLWKVPGSPSACARTPGVAYAPLSPASRRLSQEDLPKFKASPGYK